MEDSTSNIPTGDGVNEKFRTGIGGGSDCCGGRGICGGGGSDCCGGRGSDCRGGRGICSGGAYCGTACND